jgi:hypothetical protein
MNVRPVDIGNSLSRISFGRSHDDPPQPGLFHDWKTFEEPTDSVSRAFSLEKLNARPGDQMVISQDWMYVAKTREEATQVLMHGPPDMTGEKDRSYFSLSHDEGWLMTGQLLKRVGAERSSSSGWAPHEYENPSGRV